MIQQSKIECFLLKLTLLVFQVLEAWTDGAFDHCAAVRDVRGRIPHGGTHLYDEHQQDDAERGPLRFTISIAAARASEDERIAVVVAAFVLGSGCCLEYCCCFTIEN